MRRSLIVATLVLVPLVAGCSSTADSPASPTPSASSESAQHTEQGTVTNERTAAAWADNTWAKSGSVMSGVFGELHNNTDEQLTIIKLSSPAAGLVQFHEVTSDGVMQEVAAPVQIPAHGSLTLEPGGHHIMLMDISNELLPGDTVTVNIELSNGSELTLAALVKDFDGANESYEDTSHEAHTEHDGH